MNSENDDASRPYSGCRVVLLIPQLGYGGAEKSFVRLANFLAQHHDVTIALFTRHYGTGSYSEAGDEPECTIILLDGEKTPSSRIARWFLRWRRFRALKRENDVSISFLSGTNLLNAVTIGSTPTVVSVRGSRKHDTGPSPLSRFVWSRILDPLTYLLSDSVVPVSLGLAGEIRATAPISSKDKVVTIEGYIDSSRVVETADLAIEDETAGLGDLPLVVGCGRLHSQKGFRYLLPIFSRVKAHVPDAKLMLVGDGPQLDELLEQCHELNLEATQDIRKWSSADVIFPGYRDHPNRYFRIARLFVLSSLYEGLPNALIEALASGVPVIAADCPWGPRSVLSSDPVGTQQDSTLKLPAILDYGTLMPPIDAAESTEAWVSTISAMLRTEGSVRASPPQRRSMVERFDINTTGRQWLDLIEELRQPT